MPSTPTVLWRLKDSEVRDGDVKRVIDAAKAVAIPMDREVIHVIPQEFIVDDQDGIREPLGMSGVRLEAKIHIVTAAVTSAQNIVKCCNKAGPECDGHRARAPRQRGRGAGRR